MKKRISLTMDEDLLRSIDSLVDGTTAKSRSHAFEILLKRALDQEEVSQAFIVAGGKGTRLRPFTYEIPKPLMLVGGRPILEHIVNRLREYGARNIILSVGHKAEKIISHFGDGSKFGVKIDYVIDPKPLGTGGPLKMARNLLHETFLMLNGDIISNIDYQDLVEFHRISGCLATIALVEVEDPSKFGVIELKGSTIARFIEKPKPEQTSSKLINAGIYVMDRNILNQIPEGFSMVEDLFHRLASQGVLAGYVCGGEKTYWNDLGTEEAYSKLLADLERGVLDWLK